MSSTTVGTPPKRLKLSRQPARRRLLAMLVAITLLFAVVVGRLTQLQVISSSRYTSLGESERVHDVTLAADRGTIFDRNGRDLAISVPQETIWIDPSELKDSAAVAQTAVALAPILGKDEATLQNDMSTAQLNGSRFMYLKRQVDDQTAQQVQQQVTNLKLTAVHTYEEPKRFLPSDPNLSSLLGTVNIDNKGQGGLEAQYNKQLSGRPGSMVVEQGLNGQDIPGGLHHGSTAVAGDDLTLTIDSDLQNKVESDLSAQIASTHSMSGIAAVMDTKTGEILALSNLTRDPNTGDVSASPSNSALVNVYEPGSVSKLITISAALQEGVVNPSSSFTVPYQMKFSDTTFHDADNHPVENWTTTDILAASSNVGTMQIGGKLGKTLLDKYQRAYGYGSRTDLNYPAESPGLILSPKNYSGTTLYTSSIGQGVSVTAMQMLAAYNTIANNGVYVGPKLVKSTIDSAGKTHETPPSPTHQVVSTQTAQQMNRMLQEVVRVGTATAAQIPGYEVAGKTGTANKIGTNGQYVTGGYVATFAGFVPAGNPRFTAIVILDQPTPIFGGLVSAPLYADIARYALQEYQVPSVPSGSNRYGVPFASASVVAASDEPTGQAAQNNAVLTDATPTSTTMPQSSTSSSSSTSQSTTSTTVQRTTTTVARSTTSSTTTHQQTG